MILHKAELDVSNIENEQFVAYREESLVICVFEYLCLKMPILMTLTFG